MFKYQFFQNINDVLNAQARVEPGEKGITWSADEDPWGVLTTLKEQIEKELDRHMAHCLAVGRKNPDASFTKTRQMATEEYLKEGYKE